MPAYSTWNPSDINTDYVYLSDGNLSANRNGTSSGSWGGGRSTIGVSSGKWYWEIIVDVNNSLSLHLGVGSSAVSLYSHIGMSSTGWSYHSGDGYKWNNGNGNSYGNSWTASDVISIALDMDNGKIWFGKNGTWQNSGDPANGTNPAFTGLSGTLYAMFTLKNNGDKVTANFGASSFSYTVPSGFNSGLYAPPIEAEITDGSGISDQFDAVSLTGSFTDGVGISDQFDGYNLSDSPFSDGAGISETIQRILEVSKSITNNTGIADQFEAINLNDNLNEAVNIADTFLAGKDFYKTNQDAFSISDTISLLLHVYMKNQEVADAADIASVTLELTASDNAQIYSALKWTWLKTISDSLTIEDAIDAIAGMVISEWLFFSESQNVQWKGTESASSILTLVDDPKAAKVFSDLLADGFSISDIAKSLVGIILKEKLIASLTLTSTGKFQQDASDAIKFTDALPFGWDKVISDSLTISDSQVLQWLLLNVLDDQITISDTETLLKVIPKSVTDSIQLSSSVLLQQLLFSLVADTFGFSVSIELDGELWECWVLNSSKFHPSVYSGYDFNSYAVYNNTAYGCKSDGIYELSGDTDNGATINNGIILPKTSFGSSRNKRFRKAYFGISGSSPSIKIETETGSKTFSISNAKASISRDLKGKKWTLTLADFDDLDFIEIIPIILTR